MKNDIIRIRCTKQYKKNVVNQSKKRGFSTVSEYVRSLIHKDKIND